MTPPLDQLRDLKAEARDPGELQRLTALAHAWLADCRHPDLSDATRFTLAYGAAHAISMAALRNRGYRTDKRYLVFQLLPQTLGVGPGVWRVLDKAHEKRNLMEYEGHADIEPQLVRDTHEAALAALAAWEVLLRASV